MTEIHLSGLLHVCLKHWLSSYTYGTLRFSWYNASNFCSRVREATVRMLSMASVAICGNTNTSTVAVTPSSVCTLTGNPLVKQSPCLPSLLQLLLVFRSVSTDHLDACGSGHHHYGHHGQDEQRQLPAVDKTDDHTGAQVTNILGQCGQTSSCGLSRNTKRESGWRSVGNRILMQFRGSCSTHPLYLGSICGQSGSESANTVLLVVIPAKVLQNNNINNINRKEQILACIWASGLPCVVFSS